MWECRFIAAQLPKRFMHDALSSMLRRRYEVLGSELYETDDYLLAGTPRLNLKLRHRSNALKLKSLQAVTSDRLEHWRTDFEHKLPAPAQLWDTALSILKCNLEAGAMSGAESAASAMAMLRPFLGAAQWVRVEKVRWIYGDDKRRIEVSEFAFRTERFATLCVESESVSDVRDALISLDVVELGRPRNYMELLNDS